MDNQGSAGKRILIADDDPAIVESLQYILESAGFSVETTLEGDRVRNMAKKQPNLLILDVRMSGYDGRDICKRLKTHNKTRNIPVIMFSANAETERSSRQAGANYFLSKPFEMNELLRVVENHIN